MNHPKNEIRKEVRKDAQTEARKKSTGRKRTSKAARKRQMVLRLLAFAAFVWVAGAAVHGLYQRYQDGQNQKQAARGTDEGKIPRPVLDVELLTVNEYSRPGLALEKVRGVVIHYTANPGTSAIANRSYFEGLKDSHITKASSHFIVGLEGEIVQCVPCSEIAYASNRRNTDTVAIECCIEDDTGKFNKATYHAVIHLTAWLVEHFQLEVSDVIRHYDVTGKACPKYFVDHPAEWDHFLADVRAYLKRYGESK